MAETATKPIVDERLFVDAYISHGPDLYRVAYCGPSSLTLEDARRSNAHGTHLITMSIPSVIANYKLERAAPRGRLRTAAPEPKG